MKLTALGYTEALETYRKENNLDSFEVGRVISEHKDRYIVKTEDRELDAELLGNLRFTAESRADLPAVGDWVALSQYDEDKALIHSVFPRHAIIERQAIGRASQKQIIATNIDYGFIVQSVNRDFSINRLERYLTICNASRVVPVIILSKIDLISEEEVDTLLDEIKKRIKGVLILAVSNESQLGLDAIQAIIQTGKTYCLLGSSGVGKSTLLNNLAGRALMNTGAISESIDRGKHVSSHRELIVLENGGILIDNPGMREVGITETSEGIEGTFEEIMSLAQNCKFKDCTHVNEKGCAVLAAVDRGGIDGDAYDNFQKMERERSHFESSIEQKRKKGKNLSKLIRNAQNHKRNNKQDKF